MHFLLPSSPRFPIASIVLVCVALFGAAEVDAQTPVFAPVPASTAPAAAGGSGLGGTGLGGTFGGSAGSAASQAGSANSGSLRPDSTPGVGSRNSAQGLIDAATARSANQPDTATDNNLPAFRDISADSTEFQQFVAASTGRKLPLFGYNLFSGSRFSSLNNVPVPADYIIGPGDEVVMQIYGLLDADARMTVDRNGQISVPKVGTFRLAGTRASQLETVLRSQISKTYANYQLSATLGQLRSMQIFVVGQARRPGVYTVSSLSTFVSALFEIGGPSANGSLRNIQLKRDGRVISTIDLYQFIRQGDKSADAQLRAGDVIVIPTAGPRVAVLGAVDMPAIYELKSAQEPMADVLTYGGGVLSLTSPHKVLVERIDTAQGRAPRTIEDRALDAQGLKSTLRDGDVVTLFKISPEFSNAVTLRGNVAAPLRYAFRPGMRVSDLIPEREALIQGDYYVRKNAMVQFESGAVVSGGRVVNDVKNLLEEINWDYAVVERLDPKEVRSILIPFNLSKAVRDKDPAHNLQLLTGDVVTIFGVSDVPVPIEKRTQFVSVGGEVKVPGFYQLKSGETLAQLIQRAGGLTIDAFAYGTVFTRESTRRQQQANLDQAVRRMEADIASQTAAELQNITSSEKAVGIEAQVQSQRILAARLRGLKASGRISLEMAPVDSVFPEIKLEDGDRVVVPNSPDFIGVVGAVMAETSFIYRANSTANNYLMRAGATRDAEVESAMIIRADGSVESDFTAASSWFGRSTTVLTRPMHPGDTLFVPEKVDRRTGYSKFIQGAKDWTAILYQFGLGAAALKTLRQ
jgi:protein involved in polysaccharide export with SLBB domain